MRQIQWEEIQCGNVVILEHQWSYENYGNRYTINHKQEGIVTRVDRAEELDGVMRMVGVTLGSGPSYDRRNLVRVTLVSEKP